MAKKSKDELFEAFLADLKAINPKFEEIASDEGVKSKLREGVLARADYNASMDALRTREQEVEQFLAGEKQKIAGWSDWYRDTSAQFATTADELKRYKEEFGDLSAEGQRREARKFGMTPEELKSTIAQEIQQRDTAAIKFVDDLTDLKIEHRQKFNEKLDTEAVFKIAGDKQLPLDVAYSVYIADKVEDLRTKDVAAQIAKAKEEGRREALAEHKLPILSSASDVVHVLDHNKDIPKDPNSRVAAAVAAWRDRK